MIDDSNDGATYILPIKSTAFAGAELTEYVRWLASVPGVQTIVVDGSPAEIFDTHAAAFGSSALHVRPDSQLRTPMGKVGGVLTGVRLAANETIIVADDDVRYDTASLTAVKDALRTADIVRPQNYFAPLPFYAVWDTGRALLNRVSGGDWPGTLGVRRSALRTTDGYDGRAMFENLELVRTVTAAGGREIVRPDIYVLRRPSTARHFWSQRVRQAYDEIARPRRLLAQLAILPATILLGVSGRWLLVPVAIALIMGLAEAGRRRSGGVRFFPVTATLLAPAWVAERAICSWLAVGCRVFLGGVPYRGSVLRHAATSMRILRQRHGNTALVLNQRTAAPRQSA